MMVAVDQIANWLIGDLPDFREVDLGRFAPCVADRIGRDHTGGRNDEHRLHAAMAEDVDVLGAFDLARLELRHGGFRCWRRLFGCRLRSGRLTERHQNACHHRNEDALHGWAPSEGGATDYAIGGAAPFTRWGEE